MERSILAIERKGWKKLSVAGCVFFLIGQGNLPFAVYGKLRKFDLHGRVQGLCLTDEGLADHNPGLNPAQDLFFFFFNLIEIKFTYTVPI